MSLSHRHFIAALAMTGMLAVAPAKATTPSSPEEVAATAKLNSDIAQANSDADARFAAQQRDYLQKKQDNEQLWQDYRVKVKDTETQQAKYQDEKKQNDLQQERYQARMKRYGAQVVPVSSPGH